MRVQRNFELRFVIQGLNKWLLKLVAPSDHLMETSESYLTVLHLYRSYSSALQALCSFVSTLFMCTNVTVKQCFFFYLWNSKKLGTVVCPSGGEHGRCE